MDLQEGSLDAIDWQILRELQADGRLSYKELARRIGLTGPSIGDRVKKLEKAGIIPNYGMRVDVAKLGLPLLVFIELRCFPDKSLLESSKAEEFPEILEIYKLSGRNNFLLKAALFSLEHLDIFSDRLNAYGDQNVHVVTSTLFSQRLIDLEDAEFDFYPARQFVWDKREV